MKKLLSHLHKTAHNKVLSNRVMISGIRHCRLVFCGELCEFKILRNTSSFYIFHDNWVTSPAERCFCHLIKRNELILLSCGFVGGIHLRETTEQIKPKLSAWPGFFLHRDIFGAAQRGLSQRQRKNHQHQYDSTIIDIFVD